MSVKTGRLDATAKNVRQEVTETRPHHWAVANAIVTDMATWSLAFAIDRPACAFAAITPRAISVSVADGATTGILVMPECATMAVCLEVCWVAKGMVSRVLVVDTLNLRFGIIIWATHQRESACGLSVPRRISLWMRQPQRFRA